MNELVKPPSIQDRLDNISYKVDTEYTPSAFSIKFINFIKLVNGGGEEHPSPIMHYRMLDTLTTPATHVANLCSRGTAKALATSHMLLTPTGYVSVGNCIVGDTIYDRDGKETKILVKSKVFTNQMYEIRLNNGICLRVNEDHINIAMQYHDDGSTSEHELETPDLITAFDNGDNIAIPHVTSPIEFGNLNYGSVNEGVTSAHFCYQCKLIPMALLRGSVKTRIGVLQGLVRLMGEVTAEGYVELQCAGTEVEFIEDICSLTTELGCSVTHRAIKHGVFRLHLKLPDSVIPVDDPLDVRVWDIIRSEYDHPYFIQSITELPVRNSQCIQVDSPTEAFIVKDGLITHNTSLFGEYMFLYIAFYNELPHVGKVPLAIYVSDSIDNGVKNMRRNLQYRWENSEFLQKYVPKAKFTDVRWEFTNLDGVVTIIKGYGALTGVRGAKELGQRLYLAVLDDLISDKDAKSPTVIESIEDVVDKAVEYAMHPVRSKVIWSGTPFNARDPLYKAVESGAWASNVFPICERFPVEPDAFEGAWTTRFSYDYVKSKYDKAKLTGALASFNQELMLRIMSKDEQLITEDDIGTFYLKSLLGNIDRFNIYITTDFATSAKQSADNSVIHVWAYNNAGQWYWLDGICVKQDMGRNMNDLFRLVSKYPPLSVGIEVSGQQGGFIPWIEGEMINRNIFFKLASETDSSSIKTKGIRPTTNKEQRFSVLIPVIKRGDMFFPSDSTNPALTELKEEVFLVASDGFRSKYDDSLDAMSMLGLMSPVKPNTESEVVLTKKTEPSSHNPYGVNTLGEEYEYSEESYHNPYIV